MWRSGNIFPRKFLLTPGRGRPFSLNSALGYLDPAAAPSPACTRTPPRIHPHERQTSPHRPVLLTPSSLVSSPARADFIYRATNNNSITRTDTQTQVTTTFASTGLNLPTGLAFDSANNLYVANFISNTIEKFTPGGVASVFASTGLSNPLGLAFDASGNLYVANQGNGTIEKFTPGGVGSVFATTGLGSLEGLAFDSAGNLYVASDAANIIEKITPGGIGSVFFTFTGTSRGVGLAFDSAGNLYAASDATKRS